MFEANADDPLVKSSAPYQRPLSPESEEWLDEVILRLKSYVKHHGYDVKSWFTDFDKYNNGYVTYNQFRRGIPQNLLSQEEEELLVAQYGEPLTGTVNYFKLNTTVNRKKPKAATTDQRLVAKAKQEDGYEEHIPLGTEEILHTVFTANVKPDCRTVEDKIKKIVFKDRIRLMEFFRDYDRHNSGIVSENHVLITNKVFGWITPLPGRSRCY